MILMLGYIRSFMALESLAELVLLMGVLLKGKDSRTIDKSYWKTDIVGME